MLEGAQCKWCLKPMAEGAYECNHCGAPISDVEEWEDTGSAVTRDDFTPEPVWRWAKVRWRCIAHDEALCPACADVVPLPEFQGAKDQLYPTPVDNQGFGSVKVKGYAPPLSEVGRWTPGGYVCPTCGGMKFDRQRRGADAGIAVAVGLPRWVAPKRYLVCRGCGEMFRDQ